jgi:HlyD family secretion protein
MVKKVLLGCGVPLVVVGFLVFLSIKTLLKPKPKHELSETVTRGDVDIKVVETGTIEPLSKVDVKSKVGGRVLNLFVEEGAQVRQGQKLATIDPVDVDPQVAALRAQLAAAKARLASAQKNTMYQTAMTGTSIDQYVHNLAAARARLNGAETEAKAQPELTRQSIDIAQANLDAAVAAYKAQQQSLDLLVKSTHPNNVASALSSYDQARAQADNARRNLARQRQLLTKGFVAQQVVDAAETDSQVADAHRIEVKEKLDRIKQTNALEEENALSQVANALGVVNQMKAALAQAKSSTLPATKVSDLENARAAYEQAKAQLDAAKSGRTQDLMRRDDALAAAADAQNIENQLKVQLVAKNDTTIVAPMTGIVTKRYAEKGDLITSAIGSFSAGSPIYQVADLHTMLVKINVNEVDIAKVKVGMATEVTIDASRGVTFMGRVNKVAPSALADSTSGSSTASTSTQSVIRFPVEIRVDHADPRLKPGMSAHCTIVVARHRDVLRLPTNCIKGDGPKATVDIVTAGVQNGNPTEIVTPRSVAVGLRGDDFVELVEGVKEGEKVRPRPYKGPPRKGVDMNGGPNNNND